MLVSFFLLCCISFLSSSFISFRFSWSFSCTFSACVCSTTQVSPRPTRFSFCLLFIVASLFVALVMSSSLLSRLLCFACMPLTIYASSFPVVHSSVAQPVCLQLFLWHWVAGLAVSLAVTSPPNVLHVLHVLLIPHTPDPDPDGLLIVLFVIFRHSHRVLNTAARETLAGPSRGNRKHGAAALGHGSAVVGSQAAPHDRDGCSTPPCVFWQAFSVSASTKRSGVPATTRGCHLSVRRACSKRD